LNVEGLKRRGFSDERLQALKEAYRILYRSDLSLELAIEQLLPLEGASEDVTRLREFLEESGRSIVR
jgi:UDP-N-acetylglucosamine acyltransferase